MKKSSKKIAARVSKGETEFRAALEDTLWRNIADFREYFRSDGV